MQHSSSIFRILMVLLMGLAVSHCKSNSDFSGTSEAKKPKKVRQEQPVEDNDFDANPVDNDNDFDQTDPPTSVDECLEYKAKIYNIVLIFDNSGSQKETDPQNIRRTAAINFVNAFRDFQQGHVETKINMSSISFSGIAIKGSWVDLSYGVDGIIQQINMHTSSPGGNTIYSGPLKAAHELLQQKSGQPKTRNYVIFLTDGGPTISGARRYSGDSFQSIEQARNTLITNNNASIISIAAGSQIENEAADIVRKLSDLPSQSSQGFEESKYEGQYYRAQSGNELNQVWDDLFKKIGTCK